MDVINLDATRNTNEGPDALARPSKPSDATGHRSRREEAAEEWLAQVDRLNLELSVAAESLETIQIVGDDYQCESDDAFKKLGIPVRCRPHYPSAAILLLVRELKRLAYESSELVNALEECPEHLMESIKTPRGTSKGR